MQLAPTVSGTPTWRQLIGEPLQLDRMDRWLLRSILALSRRLVIEVRGAERIGAGRDPFLVCANHTTRAEAVLLPTLLTFHRGGRRIHFLADWPMMLVPVVGLTYRRGEVILVTGKSARFRALNVFRPRFAEAAHTRAVARLRAGRSVGIFPEGTMNRDPARLLRGRLGAARISMQAGVPVVPVGIRYPDHRGDGPIRDWERMAVDVGEPIAPPCPDPGGGPSRRLAQAYHVRIMERISELCGKSFYPDTRRHDDGDDRHD